MTYDEFRRQLGKAGLTVKEFAVLTDRSVDESQNILDAMTQENKLVITTTSRGAIWKWKQ